MGIKNSTTTFVQSLGSTQGRLVRLEVLVLFSAFIWILVQLFGSRRRRHSHGFFRFFVWAVYTLFTVLGPYTIGLLQDGPFRDQTFVLWGVLLLFIQVSADSFSVYSIHDIEQRNRVLVQHMLQIILVLWLIVNGKGHNKSYTATIWIFWIKSIIWTFRNSGNLSNASKKGGLLKQSKVVADYMMVEHERTLEDQNGPKPQTMEGYRYIFHGEEELTSLLPAAPGYRVELEEVGRKCTTIDSMWGWIETLTVYTAEDTETLKHVALSFTLFKLLKRRLCGYRIGEAGRAKTLDFVLNGLISQEGNYARAFGVIEMELAFLYDFLYTRFDTELVGYKGFAACLVITMVVWNFVSGAFSKHYHRSDLEQRGRGTDAIRWVTVVMLTIVLVLSFLPSDWDRRWDIVDDLHDRKAPSKSSISDAKDEANKSWQRALGQYSLLLNFDYHPWNVLPLLSLGMVDKTREGHKAGEKIKLTTGVIARVLSGFKESNGQFSYGTTIAMDRHQDAPTSDYGIAETLSNYCAYLVAFVPDMLPDHGYDTQRIFDAVVMEARGSLNGCDDLSSRCEKLMMAVLPSDSKCTILELGVRLGRELRAAVPDEERRWKVLADFWAEFILFLAPSSNGEIHAERLAVGGEFMTHLWALLTHAGILERPSRIDTAGGNDNGTPAYGSPV
ncbi:hypothetical protein BS78_10G023400 [Paspalum vaginatum]|nr:hypothetical protein BS78_10G023400 [Paspalum vaginatum]